jgi:DNA polymerase IV
MALVLPPTYLLQVRLTFERLQELEEQIGEALTYDISEAKLVLGKVNQKQRAVFELRSRNLWTEEVAQAKGNDIGVKSDDDKMVVAPPRKRRRIENEKGKDVVVLDSDTEPEDDHVPQMKKSISQKAQGKSQSHDKNSPIDSVTSIPFQPVSSHSAASSTIIGEEPRILEWRNNTIKIVNIEWFEKSITVGYLLPLGKYLIYEGRPVPQPGFVSAEPIITKVDSLNF